MKIEERNIDELLIAYLLKELDQKEIESVERWINASNENKSEYKKVKKLWGEAAQSNIKFDKKQAWTNVSSQINKKVFFIKPWMSIAASLLLLVSAYFVFQNLNQRFTASDALADSDHLVTQEPVFVIAEKDQTVKTLTDGSKVRLNSHSKISYNTNFNINKREIALTGEAFFSISRNISKPFIINTEDSKIEVLGTSFNIKAHPKDSIISVVVVSGLVRFSYLPQDTTRPYQQIMLSAGKKIVYNKNSRKILLFDDRAYHQIDTFWMNNKLSFEGIRLEKVVKILEIIYDVKIVLLNKNLNRCQISVGFENDDINKIMEVIAITFNIQVEHVDNTYILKGKACED